METRATWVKKLSNNDFREKLSKMSPLAVLLGRDFLENTDEEHEGTDQKDEEKDEDEIAHENQNDVNDVE